MDGIINSTKAFSEEKLDAGFVLNKLNTKQQFFFLSGMVEGIAYSKFLRDRPDETAMKCATNWFYADTAKRWRQIKTVFQKHQDKPPAVLVHALMKKECGT